MLSFGYLSLDFVFYLILWPSDEPEGDFRGTLGVTMGGNPFPAISP
jgi:hypothetical protein